MIAPGKSINFKILGVAILHAVGRIELKSKMEY